MPKYKKMTGQRSENVALLGVYLPKNFINAVKSHSRRLGLSFTQYAFLSFFRSLFDGLYENDKAWGGQVLLTTESGELVDKVCSESGIKRGALVNYLVRKALEGKDKRMDLDSLIDEITRDGMEDAV